MTDIWCVVTETGKRYVLDYRGNAGFGPINVWDNGQLVPVRYRHKFGELSRCGTCADPLSAHTYLPSQYWETPDLARTGEPGSGDGDRGVFVATFTRGPDYPNRPMLAHVWRRNWWCRWQDHSVVEFDPNGDWRAAFDTWRQVTTGYQPPSGTDIPAHRGVPATLARQ